MDLTLYSPIIRLEVTSFGNSRTEYMDTTTMEKGPYGPVFDVWLNENDIQEIIMSSSNFGMTLAARKFYKNNHKELKELLNEQHAKD